MPQSGRKDSERRGCSVQQMLRTQGRQSCVPVQMPKLARHTLGRGQGAASRSQPLPPRYATSAIKPAGADVPVLLLAQRSVLVKRYSGFANATPDSGSRGSNRRKPMSAASPTSGPQRIRIRGSGGRRGRSRQLLDCFCMPVGTFLHLAGQVPPPAVSGSEAPGAEDRKALFQSNLPVARTIVNRGRKG